MNHNLTPEAIRAFRREVYHYFGRYGRDTLPWRSGYDPYHILVSEIMLQQTQVDRVIGKFAAFIDRFPDIQSLARSPLDAVLTVWQGLGYNRRAVALREAANIIAKDFGGIVPNDPEKLCTLPGIGGATAASITVFAYNKPVVFLETNIRTVLIHHFFSEEETVDDAALFPLARAVLDKRNPRKWYSALMDYGTMLKKTFGNLSRNSTTYKKQTPFAGSRRQMRGALIRWLIERRIGTAAAIARSIGRSTDETTVVLDRLVTEGLAIKEGQRYRIAQ